MDLSGEYVKMCETSEQLQAEYETVRWAHVGGHSSHWKDKFYFYATPTDLYLLCVEVRGGVFVILRQDQLQGMIIRDLGAHDMIVKFREFYLHNWFNLSEPPERPSMEQLWLGFVMKEKYQKCWDMREGKWKDLENWGNDGMG